MTLQPWSSCCEGAEQFLLRMLPDDKACVGAFNDKIEFASSFSSNRERADCRAQGPRLRQPHPALRCDRRQPDPAAGHRGTARRPGLHRRRRHGQQDGHGARARTGANEEVMIYAIGLQSNYFNGQMHVRTKPDRGLRRLAEETGGGYFELERTAELSPTFTRVSEELHSQYLMGFTPDGARRQGPQARGPDQAAEHAGAGEEELPGGVRAAGTSEEEVSRLPAGRCANSRAPKRAQRRAGRLRAGRRRANPPCQRTVRTSSAPSFPCLTQA